MQRYSHLRYKLTEKVDRHGCSCKLPKERLEELLSASELDKSVHKKVLAGVGDDAGIVEISSDKVLIQHLDFFTPIIDDPYIQGEIALCNVVSDIFSKGGIDITGVLMIMGVSIDMPEDIMLEQVKGFRAACISLDAPIVGGQTIYSGWPILGGAATAISNTDEIVFNSGAKPGDVLILTKPLGTQPVMATLRRSTGEQRVLMESMPESVISRAIDSAIAVMTTPNKGAAEAMLETEVHASTDLTGFGILGHSSIMARRSGVDIRINTLPVIKGAVEIADALGYDLKAGKCAETSGGLLISVARGNSADLLISSLKRRGIPAYEIGYVEEGVGNAYISKEPTLLQEDFP